MALHYQESDPILLGAGELFIGLAKNIEDLEELTEQEEEDLTNIGAIESGATINIENTYQEVKSANRGTVARMKVDSEVTFNSGIMTWVMENVAKFLSGSKYTESEDGLERKMVIGHQDESPEVYLRFIHNKKDGGQLIVNIYKAVFNEALNFDFNLENPVTINYAFAALTNVKNNYVEFIETFPSEEEPEIED